MRSLWKHDVAELSREKAFLIRLLRHFYIVIRGLAEPRLSIRAASLVYTTLLSLVPLIAVGFSVLTAFGVEDKIQPLLYDYLSPLGKQGAVIADRIISYVENIRAGILGTVGLGFLIYTVISMVQKIEEAFNTIWGVDQERPLLQKFRDYLSIVFLGPVIVVIVVGMTASFTSTALVQRILEYGPVTYVLTRMIPFVFICALLTFLYAYFPNTRVKLTAAFIGGIFGALLWELAGWAFSTFIATSTRYPAIYSTFAIVMIAFIWVYLSWLVVLIGAEIAFFQQYPRSAIPGWERLPLANRQRELLALLIMFLVGYNFYHNKKPWTRDALVYRTGVYIEHIREILHVLRRNGLLAEALGDPPGFHPARALDTIRLGDIIEAVHTGFEHAHFGSATRSIAEVDDLMLRLDQATAGVFDERTLGEFVAGYTGPEP